MVASALYDRLFNSSKMSGGASKKNSLLALLMDKKEFFIKIFANLIVQLGITYYTFLKIPGNYVPKINLWVLIIGMILLIFGIALPLPTWLKFIMFCMFSIINGFLLSSLKTTVSAQIIQNALMGAMTIFVFMFSFALSLFGFGIYLNNTVGRYLFWALLLLIVLQFANMIAGTMFQKAFAFFGLLLFSIYIVYDTHKILSRDYFGDFVTASFDYYLDILNIFIDIVTLNNH